MSAFLQFLCFWSCYVFIVFLHLSENNLYHCAAESPHYCKLLVPASWIIYRLIWNVIVFLHTILLLVLLFLLNDWLLLYYASIDLLPFRWQQQINYYTFVAPLFMPVIFKRDALFENNLCAPMWYIKKLLMFCNNYCKK